MPPSNRTPTRMKVLVASSHEEADFLKKEFPGLRFYVVLTPDGDLPEHLPVGRYVWAPSTAALPARTRLRLRGVLSSKIDARSVEEEFPDTLLSW